MVVDRRRTPRFELPIDTDVLIRSEKSANVAMVNDVSLGGICVLLVGRGDLCLGQDVTVEYRGRQARAVVRNLDSDGLCTAYGLEWVDPVPLELWPSDIKKKEGHPPAG